MRRLTGIGVSPGIVAGRAVILIQRAQVLRYQIAAGLSSFNRHFMAFCGQAQTWMEKS